MRVLFICVESIRRNNNSIYTNAAITIRFQCCLKKRLSVDLYGLIMVYLNKSSLLILHAKCR